MYVCLCACVYACAFMFAQSLSMSMHAIDYKIVCVCASDMHIKKALVQRV